MNTKKIATYSLVILTGMMVAAFAAYFLLSSLGYSKLNTQEETLPPVTSVLLHGTVTALNVPQLSGTTTVTIAADDGQTKVIDVTALDTQECPARENIVDVHKIEVGDELAIRGEVAQDGSVVPCRDVNHYLKLIKVAPIATATSTLEAGDAVATTSEPAADARIAQPDITIAPNEKLRAATFAGALQSIDTGCYADGECFAVVDGKHVTVMRGWRQGEVGTVQGVPSFGDLQEKIGKRVEVYAQDLGDGTYSLYGSQGFYLKVIEN